MKKRLFLVPLLPGLILVLLLRSCSDEVNREAPGEANTVIFDDPATRDRRSTDLLDNPVYRIELLGNNEEMEAVAAAAESRGADLSRLNLFGIKKYFMNNSEIVMYSIPFNHSENTLIVYRYRDMYQVNQAEFTPQSNGNTRFRMLSMDGALYYGMSLNSDNEIGEYVRGDNGPMNSFSRLTEEPLPNTAGKQGGALKTKDETCCRRMADWEGCMDCTLAYFSERWYGIVGFALIGKELMAAIAVSCIGANPGTFC